MDYWKVLGLTNEASFEDVKNAYRKLAKQYHPDLNSSPDAAKKFCKIQEAYEYLCDIYSDDYSSADFDDEDENQDEDYSYDSSEDWSFDEEDEEDIDEFERFYDAKFKEFYAKCYQEYQEEKRRKREAKYGYREYSDYSGGSSGGFYSSNFEKEYAEYAENLNAKAKAKENEGAKAEEKPAANQSRPITTFGKVLLTIIGLIFGIPLLLILLALGLI